MCKNNIRTPFEFAVDAEQVVAGDGGEEDEGEALEAAAAGKAGQAAEGQAGAQAEEGAQGEEGAEAEGARRPEGRQSRRAGEEGQNRRRGTGSD